MVCGMPQLKIVQHPEGTTFAELAAAVPPGPPDGERPVEARALRERVRQQLAANPPRTGDAIAFNDAYWGEYAMRDLGRMIQRVQQHERITHVGIVWVHPTTGQVSQPHPIPPFVLMISCG